ncbi:hypothetical protein HDV00_000757 [Rhizophlyctis rosea]|nr:hypothetical protein HDV00_000757 [Rhizophlyctis rosea]
MARVSQTERNHIKAQHAQARATQFLASAIVAAIIAAAVGIDIFYNNTAATSAVFKTVRSQIPFTYVAVWPHAQTDPTRSHTFTPIASTNSDDNDSVVRGGDDAAVGGGGEGEEGCETREEVQNVHSWWDM